VYWRNYDTKAYEAFDADQYKRLGNGIMMYKSRTYTHDCIPFKEKIDTENLHFITLNEVNTKFLTDGKSLIFWDNENEYGRYGRLDKNTPNAQSVLDNHIIKKADYNSNFTNLKVVNTDIIVDNDHIYYGYNGGISVIPIKELGFEVKIFSTEK
jgi:hypothetical protein